MKQQVKQGKFDLENLTVTFGGELSKPENRFVAKAIKVPDFKYHVKERRDAGGGCYYDGFDMVEHTQKNMYLVVKDNICIGCVIPDRFPTRFDYKSQLLTLPKKAFEFCKLLNIEYKAL